jgi:polysaccharide biosynthesis/export protein
MVKIYNGAVIPLILFIGLSLILTSCSSTKRTKFFQDIPDSGRLRSIGKAQYVEPIIQNDDILTVIIQTVDPQAALTVNAGNINSNSTASGSTNPISTLNTPTSNSSTSFGYLVDEKGEISIPILGKVKVAGLTTIEARQQIYTLADQIYKDPSVTVRFANFKVNVAGEVEKPGTYIMPNEKVTILDALTMAGDLTIYGKRENVLLIRENPDGTKTPYRINLKKTNFMTSPYYYLKQNDYIYVEPNNGKAAATDVAQARTYSIIASVLSVAIVLIYSIKR